MNVNGGPRGNEWEIIQRDGTIPPQWEGKVTRGGERSKRAIVDVFRAAA